jgi:hypothetical protein
MQVAAKVIEDGGRIVNVSTDETHMGLASSPLSISIYVQDGLCSWAHKMWKWVLMKA